MVSVKKAMHSDVVKILAVLTAVIISFGGVSHNALGNKVPIGSSIAYTLVVLVDIGGFILGKILISAISSMFAGTVLYRVVEVGGGVIIYAVTSYVWFTLLYAYLKTGKAKKVVSKK